MQRRIGTGETDLEKDTQCYAGVILVLTVYSLFGQAYKKRFWLSCQKLIALTIVFVVKYFSKKYFGTIVVCISSIHSKSAFCNI